MAGRPASASGQHRVRSRGCRGGRERGRGAQKQGIRGPPRRAQGAVGTDGRARDLDRGLDHRHLVRTLTPHLMDYTVALASADGRSLSLAQLTRSRPEALARYSALSAIANIRANLTSSPHSVLTPTDT